MKLCLPAPGTTWRGSTSAELSTAAAAEALRSMHQIQPLASATKARRPPSATAGLSET
eukprot:CAMPEP_0170632554 /NCGR_PEP_ID=MMETSP0224-20130122/35394_1 /TAXON_ID=285029 /ORGANISM="Togula jolla, Strain CCCM 725" /LENGTH=57 /DNA_ID=CAMNT_0010961283 /DNA_START=396 /DNA_END=569 /DNA_ORIENTATION=-